MEEVTLVAAAGAGLGSADVEQAPVDSSRPERMVKTAPDYTGLPKRVLRGDLYLEAMKELGIPMKVAEEQTIKLFDGSFDGKDPEKYARSFPVHNIT